MMQVLHVNMYEGLAAAAQSIGVAQHAGVHQASRHYRGSARLGLWDLRISEARPGFVGFSDIVNGNAGGTLPLPYIYARVNVNVYECLAACTNQPASPPGPNHDPT